MKKLTTVQKHFAFSLLMVAIMAMTISWLGSRAMYYYKQGNAAAKEQLGQQVVLRGKTLTIIDYSYLDETYTLDDGTVISMELASKLKVIK